MRAPWVLALAAATMVLVPAAVADEGLATGATSLNVLDAKRTTIEASITIELRNVTPDRGDTYYFYNEFSVPVPAGAEKARARSNGSSLPVSLRVDRRRLDQAGPDLFPNLLFGRTRTIVLTFEVPGETPRSKDTTRVGPGYASFAVYGVGDAGRNTVEVVAPRSMFLPRDERGLHAPEKGSTTTHTSTTSDPDGGFFAVVSLRDPVSGRRADGRGGGHLVVLRGFRDDPKWSRLRRRPGNHRDPRSSRGSSRTRGPAGSSGSARTPLPRSTGTTAGSTPDDEIVVGEQFDADLIFHESRTPGSRETASPSGGCPRAWPRSSPSGPSRPPTARPAATPGDPRVQGALPLNEWGGSASDRSGDIEVFAYPASYRATRDLTPGLDDEAFGRSSGRPCAESGPTTPRGTPTPTADGRPGRAGSTSSRPVPASRTRPPCSPGGPSPTTRREPPGAGEGASGLRGPRHGRRVVAAPGGAARRDHGAGTSAGGDGPRPGRGARRQGHGGPAGRQGHRRRGPRRHPRRPTSRPSSPSSTPRSDLAAQGRDRGPGRRRAERAASSDRDPLSELGAALLGVDDRTVTAVGLLGQGRLAEAAAPPEDAKGRADRALLVGGACRC